MCLRALISEWRPSADVLVATARSVWPARPALCGSSHCQGAAGWTHTHYRRRCVCLDNHFFARAALDCLNPPPLANLSSALQATISSTLPMWTMRRPLICARPTIYCPTRPFAASAISSQTESQSCFGILSVRTSPVFIPRQAQLQRLNDLLFVCFIVVALTSALASRRIHLV
jgi:hypothetical protein